MGRAEDIFEELVERGMDAIEDFIINRKSEELFLDFKRSANHGEGDTLDSGDWNNLSKAISGFGNSEGGVLVWGVSCGKVKGRGDVPDALRPITDVRRFVSLLEGAVSGCTIPPHTGVRSHPVINEGENGIAVTLVPKSQNTPHQSIQNTQYYIRSGSSFAPTPHAVLQGMFGRRPQPNVFSMYSVYPVEVYDNSIQAYMGVQITNAGPGIASDLYLNILFHSMPGPNCDAGIEEKNMKSWSGEFFGGRRFGTIASPDVRIGPEQSIHPIILRVTLRSPIQGDLNIEGMCGSGQSPSYKFQITNNEENLKQLHDDIIERKNSITFTVDDRLDFAGAIFRTSEDVVREMERHGVVRVW